jgi:hypothetical protein
MTILIRTSRIAKTELPKYTSNIRRLARFLGLVGFVLVVFVWGMQSGVALTQSPQAEKEPIVIKVGNQVLTESDFRKWIIELKSTHPNNVTEKEYREDAMPLAVLLALAQKGESDHLDVSKELNDWVKRKRVELLAEAALRELKGPGRQALPVFASKSPIWVNDDLLKMREAAEAREYEENKASGWLPYYFHMATTFESIISYLKESQQPQTYTAGTAQNPGPAGKAQTPEQAIDSIRNGPHSGMPPAQATGTIAGSGTSIAIKNDTPYTLWVYFSGPMSQTVQIAAQGSQSVSLNSGSYQVGAKVSDPSVIPFYGEHSYGSGTQYSETFYIGTQP